MRKPILAGAIVVVVALLSGCGSPSAVLGPVQVVTAKAAARFITVSADLPYVGYRVQLRSLSDGKVLGRLARSGPSHPLAATQETNGDVLVAETHGPCSADLYRVDPATGGVSVVRHVNHAISDLHVSPNGRSVGFMTYPICDSGHGPQAQAPPSALAVVDLATGTTTLTSTPTQLFSGVSWSPDSRRLVTSYTGTGALLILDARTPRLAAAHVIGPPSGCAFSFPSWTASGIITAATCGRTGYLEKLTPAGQLIHRWKVPACGLNGIQTTQDLPAARTLVATSSGPYHHCNGATQETFSILEPTGLHPVTAIIEAGNTSYNF
ncbi:hypothetical protein GHK86_06080 [Acidimicrobiaceae bacterium USS-CC1]|uniref:Uncharacterized protein n=1 Tax=Acidiferrimicrobium australe TaxID=2664430 RepID=A0ABW9QR30_9ACTN|nr:hypothetical protein [Acidiferrimicrobium australe]